MALLLEFKLEWKGGRHMAKDWVNKYVKLHTDRNESRNAELRSGQVAATRSPDVFGAIQDRVKDDVAAYAAGTGIDIKFGLAAGGFVVRRPQYPAATLEASLQGVTIQCKYSFMEDDTSGIKNDRTLFRIFANPDDSVQVKKNGDVYAGDSEVSEAMLTPVFDFVSRGTR